MMAKGPENYMGWKNVMRFGVLNGVSVVLVIEGAAQALEIQRDRRRLKRTKLLGRERGAL